MFLSVFRINRATPSEGLSRARGRALSFDIWFLKGLYFQNWPEYALHSFHTFHIENSFRVILRETHKTGNFLKSLMILQIRMHYAVREERLSWANRAFASSDKAECCTAWLTWRISKRGIQCRIPSWEGNRCEPSEVSDIRKRSYDFSKKKMARTKVNAGLPDRHRAAELFFGNPLHTEERRSCDFVLLVDANLIWLRVWMKPFVPHIFWFSDKNLWSQRCSFNHPVKK